jgi:hypothetical protein
VATGIDIRNVFNFKNGLEQYVRWQ